MSNPLGYAWGQCTWFVASALDWLGGAPGLGNAADWLTNAKTQHLAVGTTPVVGSVAVFKLPGPGVSTEADSSLGHVGVVTAVNPNGTYTVTSDNWGAPGITHQAVATLDQVQGFIYPPSQQAGYSGAQKALSMAGGGTPSSNPGVATLSSTGGLQTVPAGVNLNPLDPNSIFNIGNDLSVMGSWLERGVIIIIGMVLFFMGVKILFTDSPGMSEIVGTPASPGTQDTTEVTGGSTETRETRGPRGGKRGSTTTTRTHTRVVKGKPAKKGTGLRGKLSSAGGAGGKAGAAEDVAVLA